MHYLNPHADRTAGPWLSIDLQTQAISRLREVDQQWRLHPRGWIMTSVITGCWVKSAACDCIRRCGLYSKLRSGVPLSSSFPIVCPSVSPSPVLLVSPGISPVDAGPSGQSLRRDTRSAWCLGQTLQQRFLCSTHLLVLAHSSGPQHRSGQALANMLVQQPDHFTQDFFGKYAQQQLNVEMESDFWALDGGMVKTLRQGHSHSKLYFLHFPGEFCIWWPSVILWHEQKCTSMDVKFEIELHTKKKQRYHSVSKWLICRKLIIGHSNYLQVTQKGLIIHQEHSCAVYLSLICTSPKPFLPPEPQHCHINIVKVK